ncbi:SprT-like family protein [Ruminiclostridium sufflavum DSM 19573]|uniref:SprT-like family protein n=1 Tax=Ruminiclostridium sufflavum DSM 19573 TaxID=1121337 RepID=A0A318XK88_9FIRM|nr:SprT-like domain-containing protein [Ruminiclostridium sufflavum]PYG86773.1 SprT-like family protein [Ruminiclostridium sufflavum DSM 19573]
MLASDSALFERAFEVFNEVYFDCGLPDAVITIQSSPKSFGYITVHKVWTDTADSYHEINIGAEHLARPIENVLATLLHEMVHLFCMVSGINDTSKGGRYHNKLFRDEAEKCDLKIEYAQYIGYSKTSPTDRFIEVIKENGLCADISHSRTGVISVDLPPAPGGDNGTDGGSGIGGVGKRKSSTRKYRCDGCGISVRATKDVHLICGDCMTSLVKV